MTPILSDQDIKDLIHLRNHQGKIEFSIYLHSLLMDAARKRNLKQSFVECLEARIDPQIELCTLDSTMKFRSMMFDVVSVLNEYSVLQELEKFCGKYIQAYYYGSENNRLIIALKFAPPPSETNPSVDPPFNDPIWDRRLEKETSW
jgi:hypothetical protein